MGCNDITPIASSGMLFTKSGVFLEQEVNIRPTPKAIIIGNLFMGVLLVGIVFYKYTT